MPVGDHEQKTSSGGEYYLILNQNKLDRDVIEGRDGHISKGITAELLTMSLEIPILF